MALYVLLGNAEDDPVDSDLPDDDSPRQDRKRQRRSPPLEIPPFSSPRSEPGAGAPESRSTMGTSMSWLRPWRVGEATHPGPALWLGTASPSGLRGKEFQYFKLPSGIWGISESQLTTHSQSSSRAAFRAEGRRRQRQFHIQYGAPVAPRARSLESGTWAGV